MRELPVGTVTLLFTDIEGSTRMLQELGRETYVRALTAHRHLLREAFARHGGVEVEMQGDSFHFAFPYARDAVAAAVAGQRALAEHAWESQPIEVRIGLHTGEPMQVDGLYAGLDVHHASRVMSAGHGGQILLSERTAELVREELPDRGSLVDLGRHRLKDLTASQHLYQVGEADFPPLKSLNDTNLPVQPTPLVGRERELAELDALLAREEVRLLTLTGPGGSGKTRLALQAAAEAAERVPDGVFWVSLAPIPGHELVLPAVARALGVREVANEPLAVTLASFLAPRRLLLLLDNFEHVLEARALLAELHAGCPQLRLLVTSRAALELSSEHVYQVPALREDEAIELFVERAAQAGAAIAPDAAVAAICRRLDRLPLALELAAARVRVLEPPALLERLERRLPLLKGARDLPARQQTLHATIAWSHDLLDEDEQALFRRLSIFAGSFTLESAETVTGADLWTLESLLAKSLARRWGSGRLGLLETIREFAAEQLELAGEAEATGNAHAEHYLQLALQLEPHLSAGAEREGAVDRLGTELDNLRAAFIHLERAGDERLVSLASAMWRFWMARGYLETGRRWLERALRSTEDVQTELRARALEGLGVMCYLAGDLENAEQVTAEAHDLFRTLGDARGTSESLNNLGLIARYRDDVERGESLLTEASEIAHAAGEWHVVGLTRGNLAEIAAELGDYERAIAMLEELDGIYAEIGDTGRSAMGWVSRALLLLYQGRSEEAATLLASALAAAESIPQRDYVALAFVGVARTIRDRALQAQLLGAADVFVDLPLKSWTSFTPAERELREVVLAEAREGLGAAGFDEAYRSGGDLTFDEAVSRALSAVTAPREL